MNTRRRLVAAATFLSISGLVPTVMAEVSAEVDATGAYVRTVVLANASTKNVRIWTVVRSRSSYFPLNRDGDLNGDLWPQIEENDRSDGLPWVAWSRFDGRDYGLAWSHFRSGAWSPVQWVESAATTGDDLDPDLAFDSTGRPHLVWWRNEEGRGKVYLSLFLSTRWMSPYLVSDPTEDSVNPTVAILPDFRIQVDYDTPNGHVTRIVQFSRPTTITDDITPFNPTVTAEYRTGME